MILDPLVSVFGRLPVVIYVPPAVHTRRFAVGIKHAPVLLPQKGIRRSKLEREREVRSLSRIYLLVRRISGETQRITQVVRNTGIEQKVVVPVLKTVGLPADLVVKDEIVVWPFKPVSDSGRSSVHFHEFIIVQDVESYIGVGLSRVIQRYAQRGRLLAEQPWLHEACGKTRIVCSVGLEPDGKILRVSERNRPPCGLVEKTAGREVVEADADSGYERVSAPSS